jgi:hypothetical protein
MVWTLFVLIERRDDDRNERHPISAFEPVLPGVVLLGMVMVGATLLNRDDPQRTLAVLVLSGLGFAAGLIVVGLVTWLGLLLSQRIRCHQVWTFLVLSACVALVVANLPLVTPSKAIFITLAGAVVVYCGFEIARAHFRFALASVIVLAMIVGVGFPRFKYEIPGLQSYYNDFRKRAPTPSGSSASIGETVPLLDPGPTLDAWLQQKDVSERRKLVIVAASGGAYRAAFWTAKMLDSLTSHPELPGFERAIRLMTGASGGMVGLAYFAASRQPPAGVPSQTDQRCTVSGASPDLATATTVEARLVEDLARHGKKLWVVNSLTDLLTPVVQQLMKNDIPLSFWPTVNGADRGRALEEQWDTLQVSFCRLQAGEREGWRPSLIVSPYLIDWAQPLLISNLNLAGMFDRDFALEFFRAFPKAHDDFKLATAVRMNAAFPFISPAVRLPLEKRPRVVDAGYFDNFGITTAASFLRHRTVREFVRDKQLNVILIRILAFPDPKLPECSDEVDAPANSWLEASQDLIGGLFEALTSPLEGALAARETRGQFSNELLLKDLRRLYGNALEDFTFINATSASFSWHIQARELEDIRVNMASPCNTRELDRLVKWWAAKPQS